MEIFELRPDWDDDGNRKFHLIDQPDLLFGPEELHTTIPLLNQWASPQLILVERLGAADVYSCTCGCYLFSTRARRAVESAVRDSAEWLPVEVEHFGTHYLLHPLRQIPLGPKARFRANEVSGNVTVVHDYDFAVAELTEPVFYPAQAPGSAAAMAGFALPTILMTQDVANCISAARLTGIRCASRFHSGT